MNDLFERTKKLNPIRDDELMNCDHSTYQKQEEINLSITEEKSLFRKWERSNGSFLLWSMWVLLPTDPGIDDISKKVELS